jgi:hypothetical protein
MLLSSIKSSLLYWFIFFKKPLYKFLTVNQVIFQKKNLGIRNDKKRKSTLADQDLGWNKSVLCHYNHRYQAIIKKTIYINCNTASKIEKLAG